MKILLSLLLALWSSAAFSFTCTTSNGTFVPRTGGSADIHVPLTPQVGDGQNLIVDLSSYITCKNESELFYWTDLISLISGTSFGGALTNFSGTIAFNGNPYPIPYTSKSSPLQLKSLKSIQIPIRLSLTPLPTTATRNTGPAGGVAITAGSLIASIMMNQTNTGFDNNDSVDFRWNIYALNDVTIPTSTCDVDQRKVLVTLPNYPGTQPVPISVHCARNQPLSFYLSGSTDGNQSTLVNLNEGKAGSATGMGTKIMRNGVPINVNTNVSLGYIGTTPIDLGLTAGYAPTRGQVTAGTVQSIVNLNFVYQ